MTTSERTAIVRKASSKIEDRVPFLWDEYPGLSRDVVRIVLETIDEKLPRNKKTAA